MCRMTESREVPRSHERWPDAAPGSGFHRRRDLSQNRPHAALMAQEPARSEADPLEAVPFEATPNAAPGRWTDPGPAALPRVPAVGPPAAERRSGIRPNEARALPGAAAAGLPAAEMRHGIRPNEELAPVPALPGRPSAVRPSSVHPSSVHHPSSARCCPVTNLANAAAPGRHTPAKPIASAPTRWSEVCQSYSSPEQQCCHGTAYIFLRKVTNYHRVLCLVSPAAGAAATPAGDSYTDL
jgi:hypothetical protein